MVDDIVLSPEEQAEQTKEWLKKNIPSIAMGIALGVALVYGYTTYTDSKTGQSQSASALFQDIVSSDNSEQQASDNISEFKSEYAKTPYAAKVALLHAKNLVKQNKITEALDELKWAEKNTKEELITYISKLRQAEILVSEEKFEAASNILDSEAPKGFESNYLELKGDIAAAKKDYLNARELYTQALDSNNDDRAYITFLQLKINKMNSLSKSKS